MALHGNKLYSTKQYMSIYVINTSGKLTDNWIDTIS